jgi:hypothetical protein
VSSGFLQRVVVDIDRRFRGVYCLHHQDNTLYTCHRENLRSDLTEDKFSYNEKEFSESRHESGELTFLKIDTNLVIKFRYRLRVELPFFL